MRRRIRGTRYFGYYQQGIDRFILHGNIWLFYHDCGDARCPRNGKWSYNHKKLCL